jgi:hypothetical protein
MNAFRTRCAILSFLCLLAAACTAAQELGERPAPDPRPSGGQPGDVDSGDPTPPVATGRDSGSAPQDTTAPVVVLTASATRITTAGNLDLNIAVTDPSGITRVVVYSGAAALPALTAPPYAIHRALTHTDNGTYVFTAEATDGAGNVGTSAPVTVTVDIPGTTVPSVPTFVAAGAARFVADTPALMLATPPGIQTDDFLLALITAEEQGGPRTLATPAGWALIGGFPVHNLASAHPPFIIPASENHGTWIFHKFAAASEPATTTFEFPTAAMARGVMVSYRGVDTSAPIHDKSALPLYGNGDTNGMGSGNTSLDRGRQVNLIATALTARPTYTVVVPSASVTERFNTGEQPSGQNLIVHDATISFGVFLGPSIANKQSPSGSSDAFLFSATTLVLKPQ